MTVVKNILKMKIQNGRKTKQKRLMLLSNCVACGKKKSAFIKKQNSTILINLKRMKSLTNVYLLETNLCQNYI